MNGKRTYVCLTEGKVNNGMIEACGFTHDFDNIGSWNCPKCGAGLVLEGTSGKSISELLSEGFEKEKGE
tara:strand:+ start:121 stop:327 length:207 start_codon:yes stop_codon:yes gene_type:complete